MFTGIIESTGCIQYLEKSKDILHLTISTNLDIADLSLGESIAVNGVCLTVTAFSAGNFTVTVVPETLRLTNLSLLKVNNFVNLERSMRADSRISGHYVQGHADGLGEILDVKSDGTKSIVLTIQMPQHLYPFLVHKGFVALDGMSLTVIKVDIDSFTVTIIPHTKNVTIAKYYQKGTKINLETDILGRYVAHQLGVYSACNPS